MDDATAVDVEINPQRRRLSRSQTNFAPGPEAPGHAGPGWYLELLRTGNSFGRKSNRSRVPSAVGTGISEASKRVPIFPFATRRK